MTIRISARPARRYRRGDDGGFTLIESVVSVVIMLIITAAAASAIITSRNAAQVSRTRVVETNLARSDLNQAIAQPSPSPTTYTVTPAAGGNQYTVSRTVQVLPSPSSTGSCPTGAVQQITVTVGWSNRSVSMTTGLSC